MNPRFVFIADTHHFSRTLSDGGEAYAYRSESDQKCLEETGEIIDAAFEKILEDPPAAVMIAGDLSDDGERICHEEFREKLRELQKHVHNRNARLVLRRESAQIHGRRGHKRR